MALDARARPARRVRRRRESACAARTPRHAAAAPTWRSRASWTMAMTCRRLGRPMAAHRLPLVQLMLNPLRKWRPCRQSRASRRARLLMCLRRRRRPSTARAALRGTTRLRTPVRLAVTRCLSTATTAAAARSSAAVRSTGSLTPRAAVLSAPVAGAVAVTVDTVAAAVRTAGATAAGAGRATVTTAGGTPVLPRCSHAHTPCAGLTSTSTTAARRAQAARSLSAAEAKRSAGGRSACASTSSRTGPNSRTL